MKTIWKFQAFICCSLILASGLLSAQDENPPFPSNRVYHDLHYHENTNQVFLVGGAFTYGWENIEIRTIFNYDVEGKRWNYYGINRANAYTNMWGNFETPAQSPAYDSESERLIFYNKLEQIVTLDIETGEWERLFPTDSPPGRCGHHMVYDSESDRIILFGGFPCNSGAAMNDTWSYDYNSKTWMQMSPENSPPDRMYACAVYAEKEDRMYMWGGRTWDPLDDNTLWEYDYNSDTWVQLETTGGPVKTYTYASMIYHPGNSELFLFGGGELTGTTIGTPTNEGWIYSIEDSTWTKISMENAPPPISKHKMAYISETDQVLLYGGDINDFYSRIWMKDTWLFDYSTRVWKKELFSYAGDDHYYCASDMESLVLGGIPTSWGGTEPYTYTWTGTAYKDGVPIQIPEMLLDINVANPQFKSYADSSTLILSVEDQDGMVANDTAQIYFSSFSVCPDQWSALLFEEDSIQLDHCISGGIGPLAYLWQPKELLSDSVVPNPWTVPGADTLFELTVTDTLGCIARSTYNVSISTLHSELFPEDEPEVEVIFMGGGSNNRLVVQNNSSQAITMQIINMNGALMELVEIYPGSHEKQLFKYHAGLYLYHLKGNPDLQHSGKFIVY